MANRWRWNRSTTPPPHPSTNASHNAKVDTEFFPDWRFKSNFLVNLGYGEANKLRERSPRFRFDEACRIV